MRVQPNLKFKLKFKNPFKSVGQKLFMIFFASSVILVLGVGLFSYAQSKSIIETQLSESNYQTILQARDKLDLVLSNFEDISMQLLINKNLQQAFSEMVNTNSDDYSRFTAVTKAEEILQNFTFSNNIVSGITLIPITENGKIIGSNNGMLDPKTYLDTPWFKQTVEAKGKSVFVSTSADGLLRKGQGNTYALARLMNNVSTGKATHVIVIEIKLESLAKELKSLKLGEGSELQIVDSTGQIVYSQDPAKLTKKTEVVIPNDQKGKAGGSLVVEDKSGQDMLVAYSPLQTSGWTIVNSVALKEVLAPANSIFTMTIIAAIIAAVVAALVGFWVIVMVGRPLVKLRNLMNEGASGNLAVRTDTKSQDEIGQLSLGFNEMMDNITQLVEHTNQSAQEVLQTATELTDASKKTAISAREIAVATEEIANGATNLAVEAERGNDLTMNISVQMKKVVEANLEMGHAAKEVEKVSENGISHMGVLTEKTNHTEEMIRAMVEKVDALKDSTNSIRKILDVLNAMTKQTNILSLNATIEASRAGAAGKGFMVVADEIRNLADQSRQSIDVVAQITEQISGEMGETVEMLSAAYPIFKEQIHSVKEANEIFWMVQGQMGGFIQQLDGVTDSIQQLDHSQSSLAEAMSSVSAVAEEASATSEEVASLSNEQLNVGSNLVDLSNKLENVSAKLKETLSRFTL